MRIAVLVPTYRRPDQLRRCLEALARQVRLPDAVIVVVRDGDSPTMSILDRAGSHALPLRILTVSAPGQVAALNRGLEDVVEDVVAITDDDAEPRPEWLQRIERHFSATPFLGALGGRDWVHHDEKVVTGTAQSVGRLQWFGRVVGNHHLGAGPSRMVDVLKGANMSFRMAAIRHVRFDERLLGAGCQVDNDLAFSLAVRRRGWSLVYDPSVEVDHHPAPRGDDDPRHGFNATAARYAAHNGTLVVLEHLSTAGRIAFATWGTLVGTRACPGLAQWVRFLMRTDRLPKGALGAAMTGRLSGWRAWQRGARTKHRRRPGELTIVANDVAQIGGMERQLTELISGVLRHGVRVTVIARRCELSPRPGLRFVRVPGPHRPFAIAYPWFFMVASLLTLRHREGLLHTTGAIIMNRADVCTVHHLHHGTHARGGFVSRSRSSLFHRLNAWCAEPLKRAGERWCYRPAVTRHAVGDSHGLARELKDHFPSLEGHITVIPLGVDHDRGDVSTNQRDALRAELSVHDGQHVALFVGGDWERKGLRLAIEAIARTPDWHLLIVGSGDIAAFRRIAVAAGSQARTHFAGTPAGTAPYYAAADAFLLPTAYETFSVVTYEAAASRLPLLVTRVSGVEDILVDGINGWFIDRDSTQIAGRLDALGADVERRKGMGQAAQCAVDGFTWANTVDAYLALYAAIGGWMHAVPSTPTRAGDVATPPPIASDGVASSAHG